MKEIKLNGKNGIGKVTIVDDVDFEWLNKYTWNVVDGYARATVDGVSDTFMHMILITRTNGQQIDHINRNRLDNRRENLRLCTRSENQYNIGLRKDNRSGARGVYYHIRDKRWIAKTKVQGERIHIGSFKTKEDAVIAYNEFVKKHHKEFAFVNPI